MSTESDLYTALTGDASVLALVSTRCYPTTAPQDVADPYIVYTRTGTDKFTTIHGTVAAQRALFDVHCYADTRAGADALADAVEAALNPSSFFVDDRISDYLPDLDLNVAIIKCSNTF